MTIRTFKTLPDSLMSHQLIDDIEIDAERKTSRVVDKPLVLYGAGNLGRMAKDYCDRLGLKIAQVIDKQAEHHAHNTFWSGIELLQPEQAGSSIKTQSLIAICVANGVYSELKAELTEQGWVDIVHIYDITEAYRDHHPLSNGWFSNSLDKPKTKLALSGWADDLSRAYHLQFIAWRCLREDWLFEHAPILLSQRYCIPEIVSVLTKNECFADIGGHVGETTQLFLETVNYHFDSVYIVEPDKKNVTQLDANLTSLKQQFTNKITINNVALGEFADECQFFDGAGYASQLCRLGTDNVNVVTFDSLEFPATVIKLHIEGSELAVLKGARESLKQHRPIIMMTCYHNDLGLYQMSNWLMNELDDYQFLFRMHSGCGTGAVIYAIPQQRYIK